MSLVVALKCTDGLVLAADSRLTVYKFDPEIPESDRIVIIDRARKVFSFRAPFDKIGVLSYDYGAISTGFSGEENEVAAQMQRHSIDVCIRRFKQELYQTHPKKRMTVDEFKKRLEMFLIKYWEHYRDRRCSSRDQRNRYEQERKSKNPEFVPPSTLAVHLFVAGFNEGEHAGHVLPIWLTDNDEYWAGLRYRGIFPSVEMIPPRCGIFCAGMTDFVIPVLAEDDPTESIEKLQRGSTEATVAEIADMRARFGVRYVSSAPPQLIGFFSSDDITAHDAQRLAQLLVRGTIAFYGEKGGAGGAIRICTINPLTGTKCRVRS